MPLRPFKLKLPIHSHCACPDKSPAHTASQPAVGSPPSRLSNTRRLETGGAEDGRWETSTTCGWGMHAAHCALTPCVGCPLRPAFAAHAAHAVHLAHAAPRSAHSAQAGFPVAGCVCRAACTHASICSAVCTLGGTGCCSSALFLSSTPGGRFSVYLRAKTGRRQPHACPTPSLASSATMPRTAGPLQSHRRRPAKRLMPAVPPYITTVPAAKGTAAGGRAAGSCAQARTGTQFHHPACAFAGVRLPEQAAYSVAHQGWVMMSGTEMRRAGSGVSMRRSRSRQTSLTRLGACGAWCTPHD